MRFNPRPPKGGGVELTSPNYFYNNFLTKNDIEMKLCLIVNNRSVDFYKIEHCPYIKKGEGSILGTCELKQSLKIYISFLIMITQHIKELVSRNFSGLLRIIC